MRSFLMLVVVCSLAAFLVGCVTSRSSSRSTSQGAGAEATQKQSNGTTDNLVCWKKTVPGSKKKQFVCRPETKAEAKKKQRNTPRKRIVCRREHITGSIIKRVVCRDVWMDKERQREDQEYMQRVQRGSSRVRH